MKYYPVGLDLKDRKCVVVGGGSVGYRKALGLARCGARVMVVSQGFSDQFHFQEKWDFILEERSYEKGDLDHAFLVFAATNNPELNRRVLEDARQAGAICNLADAPEQGDFILPAVTAQGDLVLTVSTSGASPALAKKIKQELSGMFGPEFATFLVLMGNIRKRLLAKGHDPDRHKEIFTALVEKDLPPMIASGDIRQIDSILNEMLGSGYTYHSLVPQES